MTIRVDGETIFIEGAGKVEEAEPLLQALAASPASVVDIGGATRLHLAIVQLLIAAGTAVKGVPADPFVRDRLRGLLRTNPS